MDAAVPTAFDHPAPRDRKSRVGRWLALGVAALLVVLMGLDSAPASDGPAGSTPTAGPDEAHAADGPTARRESDWRASERPEGPLAEGPTEAEEEEDDREGGESALETSGRFGAAAPRRSSTRDLAHGAPRRDASRAHRARAPPTARA